MRFIITILILILLLPSIAAAKKLNFNYEPKLKIEWRSQEPWIVGKIIVKNHGGSFLANLTPQLSYANAYWKGSPKIIPTSRSEIWIVEKKINLKDIQCTDTCLPKNNLRPSGVFPFILDLSFRDSLGHSRNSVRVIPLIFKTNKDNVKLKQNNSVNARLETIKDGEKKFTFKVSGIIDNPNIQNLKIKFISSSRLKILKPNQIINIKNKKFKAQTQVLNISNLPGGTYPVYASVQWQENGLMYHTTGVSLVKILNHQKSSYFFIFLSSFLLLSFIFIYKYIFI